MVPLRNWLPIPWIATMILSIIGRPGVVAAIDDAESAAESEFEVLIMEISGAIESRAAELAVPYGGPRGLRRLRVEQWDRA